MNDLPVTGGSYSRDPETRQLRPAKHEVAAPPARDVAEVEAPVETSTEPKRKGGK